MGSSVGQRTDYKGVVVQRGHGKILSISIYITQKKIFTIAKHGNNNLLNNLINKSSFNSIRFNDGKSNLFGNFHYRNKQSEKS